MFFASLLPTSEDYAVLAPHFTLLGRSAQSRWTDRQYPYFLQGEKMFLACCQVDEYVVIRAVSSAPWYRYEISAWPRFQKLPDQNVIQKSD